MIPPKLNNPTLRFCRVTKGSKKPFEQNWTNKPYTSKEIMRFKDENYGILCGYGDLVVIDSDNPKLQRWVEQNLPKTYRVKTGSGGRHNYFFVPNIKKKIILYDLESEEEEHLGEVQTWGSQVVGPGSIHPNGNSYEEENNCGIAKITAEELYSKLFKFIKQFKECDENATFERKSDSEIDSLNVLDIWGQGELKKHNNEYYGEHPIHGSSGGMNFWINPSKNLWHCFRCNSGGGPLSAIAVKEGIIQCHQAQRGYLRGDKAVETLRIAQEKYGLKKKPYDEIESYDIRKINWTSKEFYNSWERVKARCINVINEKEDLLFIGHNKDEITGKPLQIHQNYQKIPLVMKLNKKKPKDDENPEHFKFLDDKIDYRYEVLIDTLAVDLLIYKVIHNNREIIVLSEKELPQEVVLLHGTMIEMNNFSEITNTLRFRSLARVFFVHSYESSVKTLDPKSLVEFCKETGLTRQDFREIIFSHPDGKVYSHPKEYEILRSAQLLSGKYEGYPLHTLTLGPAGTGKTIELESIDSKFREEKGILEAANSTPKALIPSFKEKPASPGYILSTNRVSLVDELFKMIENVPGTGAYKELINTYLGQLNMLLEHKKRYIGSGNDNSLLAKSTSKLIFQSNPVRRNENLYQHLKYVDSTTLSRMLIWVQDKEHQDFITNNSPKKVNTCEQYIISNKHIIYYNDVFTFNLEALTKTIYDSCLIFLSNMDEKRIREVFSGVLSQIPPPLKILWSARGIHHTTLLLDGIVKERCLFKDHDPSFEARDEDYDLLERVLYRMVKTWNTNFNEDIWEGKL